MTTMLPAIHFDKVCLSLPSRAGEVSILNEINLTIEAGETVAMLGPSGAGKTTAMMIMAGLESVSAGKAIVAGHDLNIMDEDALANMRRGHVGIVFQAFRLIPSMTALENVAVPLELAGVEDARTLAEGALCDVGLGHRLEHFSDQLSGGEQQRVAIARAIVTRPRILLADEPTGNLDQATGRDIINLLLELAERDKTVLVLITHDEELAKRCKRVVRISDGCIVADSKSSK